MTAPTKRAVFRPVGPLRGRVRVPADKSITQRALLVGAVGDEVAEIAGPLWAGDPAATTGMLEALGVRVEREAGGRTARVHGVGLRGLRPPAGPLDAHNSGTGMRLLAGLLTGQEGRFVLDGDESLRRRPMDRIVEPLRLMGGRVGARDGRYAPLVIEGGEVRPLEYRLPVASAQVKSCLLLAGLFADGETVVVEPAPTRDHTERLLAAAGVPVVVAGERVAVRGVTRLRVERVDVPGDISSAAFLVAAAVTVPGSELELLDVGLNPTRCGFLKVARRMGADVDWNVERESAGEPRGTVTVRASRLRGVEVAAGEIPSLVDEVTLVALLATAAEGETVVRGVGELRAKESDRLDAIVDIVLGLGGDAESDGDALLVRGRALRGGVITSRGDHRLALLGAVAGLACPQGVAIDGFEAAAVSFPDFEPILREVVAA